MKTFNEYRYTIEKILFNYKRGYISAGELIVLLKHTEKRIVKDALTSNKVHNKANMFIKFSENDTKMYSIEDIREEEAHNRTNFINVLTKCISLDVNYEIQVYLK